MTDDEKDLLLGRVSRELKSAIEEQNALEAEISRHGRAWGEFGLACRRNPVEAYTTLRGVFDGLDKARFAAVLHAHADLDVQIAELRRQKELLGG